MEKEKNKKIFIGIYVMTLALMVFYLGLILGACFLLKEGVVLGAIIVSATALFVISCFSVLKIETEITCYECKECHNKFSPTYREVVVAPHSMIRRLLRCPKCGKITWARRRILTNEDNN